MENLEPAAQRLAELVAAVRDDQLTAATPCPEYSLGDLLDHVGGAARAFAAAAAKEKGINAETPPPGDVANLGPDWRTRIPAELRKLSSAWADPAAWEGDTWIAGMQMPAATVGRVGLNELVAHGWDVARASGQGFDADPQAVDACLVLMAPMSEPGMEEVRQPAFGPVVDIPAGTPPLDRLLAFTGRDPGWSPT